MTGQRFSSVWDAIGEKEEEIQDLRLRAQLMGMIADELDNYPLGDKAIAEEKGISFAMVSDIREGKIDMLSLKDLLSISQLILPGRLKFTLT